jgi:hypothetical protein
MPRPQSEAPRLVDQAVRQRKFRQRQSAIGRPEASAVDVAIAAATAITFRWLESDPAAGREVDGAMVMGRTLKATRWDLHCCGLRF